MKLIISIVLVIAFSVIIYQMYTSSNTKELKTFNQDDFKEPHHSATLSQAIMPTESNISYEIDKCNVEDTNHHGNCPKCKPINIENEKRQQIQELSAKEKRE